MIKAVYFDFDGVLTREASGATSVCNALSAQLPHDTDTILNAYREVENKHKLGYPEISLAEHLSNRLGTTVSTQQLTHVYSATELNHEMMDLAQQLRKHYRVGIITDNPSERMHAITDHHNLTERFDALTVSANVNGVKNSKLIFESALKALDTHPANALFIDNTKENLIVPHSMGMATIHFNFGVDSAKTLTEKLRLYKVEI